MKRFIIKAILFIVILPIVFSCNNNPQKHNWIKTQNGIKIYVNNKDKENQYFWVGETFDSIAHGDGILRIYKDRTLIDIKNINAFYGSIDSKSIVKVGNNDQYIGSVSSDKFEGFGVYLKGNEIYVGEFVEGKPSGFLKLYKSGKLYYSGEWIEGKFNGMGTLYKEDGSIKSGNWEKGKLVQTEVDIQLPEGHFKGFVKNNLPDGFGTMEYQDSSKYSGNWKNGLWNGPGLYTNLTETIRSNWKNGYLNGVSSIKIPRYEYNGGYLLGFPHGLSFSKYDDQYTYLGYMMRGVREGYGEMEWQNGDSYKGDWHNNVFEGNGLYIYKQQKATYDGEWREGLQHGNGYYRSLDFTYNGMWEEGWINGEGKIVFKNGDKYKGNFVENKFHGSGIYEYANGNIYEGEFVNGKFNGLGTFYFSNGDIYSGEFKDGEIYGDGTLILMEEDKPIAITANWPGAHKFPTQGSILFSNGDIYEGELVNGMPTENGKWISEKDLANNKDWANNANDYYKEHKEDIDKVRKGMTIAMIGVVAIGAVAIVATGGAATGAVIVAVKVMNAASTALDVAAVTASTASNVVEYNNAETQEEKNEIIKASAIEAGTQIISLATKTKSGKVLKSSAQRVAKVALSNGIKEIGKKSVIKLSNKKVFGKMVSIAVDNHQVKSKQLVAASITSSFMKKSLRKKTLDGIKETLKEGELKKHTFRLLKPVLFSLFMGEKIEQINLTQEEYNSIINNPSTIGALIEKYTESPSNYVEFFIKLSNGNSQQLKGILTLPQIKEYISQNILFTSEVNNYEAAETFNRMLTDSKWKKEKGRIAFIFVDVMEKINRSNLKFRLHEHPEISSVNKKNHNLYNKVLLIFNEENSIDKIIDKLDKFASENMADDSYYEFSKNIKEYQNIK